MNIMTKGINNQKQGNNSKGIQIKTKHNNNKT